MAKEFSKSCSYCTKEDILTPGHVTVKVENETEKSNKKNRKFIRLLSAAKYLLDHIWKMISNEQKSFHIYACSTEKKWTNFKTSNETLKTCSNPLSPALTTGGESLFHDIRLASTGPLLQLVCRIKTKSLRLTSDAFNERPWGSLPKKVDLQKNFRLGALLFSQYDIKTQ